MANVITLLDGDDIVDISGTHCIIRKFRYQRSAIVGDDGPLIITPTQPPDLNTGLFIAPWIKSMGVSIENNTGAQLILPTDPAPHTSLVKNNTTDLPVIGDGQNINALSTVGWGLTIPDTKEQYRNYGALTPIQGGNLYWLVFESTDTAEADWTITITLVSN